MNDVENYINLTNQAQELVLTVKSSSSQKEKFYEKTWKYLSIWLLKNLLFGQALNKENQIYK